MKIFKRGNLLERSYMKWKLVIRVWEVDNWYEGCITYRSKSTTMEWDIPRGLDTVYPTLFQSLEEDVAPIVYEEIEKRYNETLCIAQVNNGREECYGQQFPDYRTFTLFKPKPKRIYPTIGDTRGDYDKYRIASWNLDPYEIYTTTYSDRYRTMASSGQYGSNINYMSAGEYERKKERWELNSWELYLIIN